MWRIADDIGDLLGSLTPHGRILLDSKEFLQIVKIDSQMIHQVGGDASPGAPNWSAIRDEYEGRLSLPQVICQRHGVTAAQLRHRRETEGWLSIRARVVRQDELVSRMMRVLDRQVRLLEAAVSEPIEKQAKVLASMVGTLDKLIDLGAAKRNVEPPTRKDMTDLREKLAKRLDQFKRR